MYILYTYIYIYIAKNIGLLFISKPYLTKKCLLSLYYSYIHTYTYLTLT